MISQLRLGRPTGIQLAGAAAVAAIFLLSSAVESKATDLNSMWKNRDITIDGIDNEWEDTRVYLKDADASVSVLNDSEFVYVSFVTAKEETIRQATAMGLILWFDAAGGKDKTFGIRFPLGMMESGMTPPRDFSEEGSDEERAADRAERFKKSTLEMEILGPGEDDARRVQVATLEGIEARASLSADKLVYELKIPIVKSDLHPFAIGAKPGERIGMGIETPEIDRDAMRERIGGGGREGGPPGGGMPGGGMSGGRHGGGMHGGGTRGGSGFERPKPLKVWTKVQLAAPGPSDNSSGDDGALN